MAKPRLSVPERPHLTPHELAILHLTTALHCTSSSLNLTGPNGASPDFAKPDQDLPNFSVLTKPSHTGPHATPLSHSITSTPQLKRPYRASPGLTSPCHIPRQQTSPCQAQLYLSAVTFQLRIRKRPKAPPLDALKSPKPALRPASVKS